MTRATAKKDKKQKMEEKVQKQEPSHSQHRGSGTYGFFHRYQRLIIYTAGIFTLITISITGALTGFMDRMFGLKATHPTMSMPGHGAVKITQEDVDVAKWISRIGYHGALFVIPGIGTDDGEQVNFFERTAAIRRLAIEAGIEASETDADRAMQTAVESLPTVESVSQLAGRMGFSDVTGFRNAVVEAMRVGLFLRLSILGNGQGPKEIEEQVKLQNERISFTVAHFDREAYKKGLKAGLKDEAVKKTKLEEYLSKKTEEEQIGYRLRSNKCAIKIAMLLDEKFKMEDYVEEIGDYQVGDPDVQGRYQMVKDRRFRIEKKGEDGDKRKDEETKDEETEGKENDEKKKLDESDRGNGSADPLAQSSEQAEELDKKQNEDKVPPKPQLQDQGQGQKPPEDQELGPPVQQEPEYRPLDEELKAVLQKEIYVEHVLSKWWKALDQQMAQHMREKVNARTEVNFEVDEKKEAQNKAEKELAEDEENAELKKKVEEAKAAVAQAEKMAKAAADAVDAQRKSFDLGKAMETLAKGRAGLQIVEIKEMLDAEGLRQLPEGMGEWQDSQLPGQMQRVGEIHSRVQRVEKGAFLFQVTEVEPRPYQPFDEIKERLEADYVTGKLDEESKSRKEAFEKALEKLAREKIKDKIAELEKKRDEELKKECEDWEKGLSEEIQKLAAKLKTMEDTRIAYGMISKTLVKKQDELKGKADHEKELRKKLEEKTEEEIEKEAKKVHKEVVVEAAKEAKFKIEEIGPYSKALKSSPRFQHRFKKVVQSIFMDDKLLDLKEGTASDLQDTPDNLWLAVCRKVEKADIRQISRRQWMSTIQGGGGTSFAGNQMVKAVEQSYRVEALKKGYAYKTPEAPKEEGKEKGVSQGDAQEDNRKKRER